MRSNSEQLSESILKALAYYDVFNYPLRSEEIFAFLSTNHVDKHHVENELKNLLSQTLVYQLGEFYSIRNDLTLEARRLAGNAEAKRSLEIAYRQAKLIFSFPFVKAVLASGSLSKGYMDKNSDLDFFVITQPGRLWVARTLLALYKRIFLFNSHKYFCVNYYVDSDHLEIDEKNLFTATELATLIPLCEAQLYVNLIEKNNWIYSLLPNYRPRTIEHVVEPKQSFIKILLEKLLNSTLCNLMENFCMSFALGRWKRMYQGKYSEEDFNIAFKSTKHASKNHPRNYQKKVRDLYEDKLNSLPMKLVSNWKYYE